MKNIKNKGGIICRSVIFSVLLILFLGCAVFGFFNNCSFWKTMELCDWSFEGDDDKVLAPVVDFLSNKDDDVIFHFDDTVYKLLHSLDTKEIRERYKAKSKYVSDDLFLYWRCVALINGRQYYNSVRKGTGECQFDCEFESLLYAAKHAWAKKHDADVSEYPHIPKYFE